MAILPVVGSEVTITHHGAIVRIDMVTRFVANQANMGARFDAFVAGRRTYNCADGHAITGSTAYVARLATDGDRAAVQNADRAAAANADMLAEALVKVRARDPDGHGHKHTDSDGWTITVREPKRSAR